MRGRKPGIKLDLDSIKDMPPPEEMGDDAAAEWERTLPVLARRRVMTETDLAMFESYCVMVGFAREAERDIREHGLSLRIYKVDKEGDQVLVGVRKNPSVSILSDMTNKARLLAAELGCTPASRSRPAIEEGDAAMRDLWSDGAVSVVQGGRL